MSLPELHQALDNRSNQNSNSNIKTEITNLKKELDTTALLLVDSFPSLTRYINILNDAGSDDAKVKASLQAIKNVLHAQYLNSFIDGNKDLSDKGKRQISELPDQSLGAIKLLKPNATSRIDKISDLIQKIKGDFPTQNSNISYLREKSLKSLSPLILNVLLDGPDTSFNSFVSKYEAKYTIYLKAKNNILSANTASIEQEHQEAEFRRKIQDIKSMGIYGVAEYNDLTAIKDEVAQSSMSDSQKTILLGIIHTFAPELNSGARRDRLINEVTETTTISDSASNGQKSDKEILIDIIQNTSPESGNIIDITLVSKQISDSSIVDKNEANNYILGLQLSQNIVLSLRELKNAINIGLEQLENTKENPDKSVEITLNARNLSQKVRQGIGNISDLATGKLSTIIGQPAIKTSFNHSTQEYTLTFNPVQDGSEIIGGRQNALDTLSAFTMFLETQESISLESGADWIKNKAFNAGVGITKYASWETANLLLVDYPIFLAEHIALPAIDATGVIDYFGGEIDEGEAMLRLIFLGVLPVALLGPTIYNIIERADTGVKGEVINDIVATLKVLEGQYGETGNKGGQKKINDFLDELKTFMPESVDDNIVGLKDPLRTKKIFYRLLNKHFSEYQGVFKSVPGMFGDYADQPVLQRGSPKVNSKGEEYGFLRKNMWRVLKFYSNILLGPTKFINRGPSSGLVEFGNKGDSLVERMKKFRVMGWGIFLKDSAIIMHGEKIHAQVLREAKKAELLKDVPSAKKAGVQAEIREIEKGMLFFTKHAPYTRFNRKGNVNQQIAEAISRQTGGNLENIKKGFDKIDSDFKGTIDTMKQITELRLESYIHFIKGHSGISDSVEKKLLQSISEIRYTAKSVSDFELQMGHLFSQIPTVSPSLKPIGFSEIAKIQVEYIGPPFDNKMKAETLTGFRNMLISVGTDATKANNYYNMLDNFIGEKRELSQKHVCYAMNAIANGQNITPDELLNPKAIHDFLGGPNNIPKEVSPFIRDGSAFKAPADSTYLQPTQPEDIDFNRNGINTTEVGRRRITDPILGIKKLRKMRTAEVVPPSMWKHDVYRNSFTTPFDKLTPQEQALDLLLRQKINLTMDRLGLRTQDGLKTNQTLINVLSQQIKSIKKSDSVLIGNVVSRHTSVDSVNLPEWSQITENLSTIQGVDFRSILNQFSQTDPRIHQKFKKSFNTNSNGHISRTDVKTLLKYIYKGL